MSKNYIKEFMKHNNLKIGEKFKVIAKEDGNVFKNYICWFDDKSVLRVDSRIDAVEYNYIYQTLIMGRYKIEKIKPKTLLEQLKEQGFGWHWHVSGDIIRWDYCDATEHFTRAVKRGNMFLTKSDAGREAYRIKLEFEMQEWARENDCLDMKDGSEAFKHFNIYIKHEYLEKIYMKYRNKVSRYNGWSLYDAIF